MPPKLTDEQKRAIGARIAVLRDAHGMTQGALASKVFVSQPAVSQWESGETLPAKPSQERLADVLHTTRAQLFRELAEAEWVAVAGGAA